MDASVINFSIRIRLGKDQIFFGPGVAQLLRLVEQTGSLLTATEHMGMSYSKAWKIVRKAETELGFTLLERHVGGLGGGSSKPTAECIDFLNRFENFQRDINEVADSLFIQHFGKR